MQVADRAYQEHRVFTELLQYIEFYEQLAMSVFSFPTMGTKAIGNIDAYIYSSIQGTVDSIRTILPKGRINDAYALLRVLYDSAIINIYSNLYLRDNFRIESFVVEKIDNWFQGKERLPEYRIMSQYIKASKSLEPINKVLSGDDRYKCIRNRCNDHTHYNFYRHAMLNDGEVYMSRGKWIDLMSDDVQDIFILHLGYIFFLNDHYMMSSDYLDALECDMQPEDNSQYWVAPFIQVVFDEIITPRRPDITAVIKAKTTMQLS